jgi:hypothetical protein
MRRHTITGARLGIPLAAVALVTQATLLPVLHAEHAAVARLERGIGIAVDAPASDVALFAAADDLHGTAHDLASCPVCATLGRAGAALTPAPVANGALPGFSGALWTASSIAAATPDLTRGGARGPPALVS